MDRCRKDDFKQKNLKVGTLPRYYQHGHPIFYVLIYTHTHTHFIPALILLKVNQNKVILITILIC